MNELFTLKKLGTYIIGAALGLLVGAILYFVQPAKWKGQALVKVGQISQNQNQSQNQSQNQNYIEPLETVMERLKSHSFIQGVAQRAKRDDINKFLNFDEDAGMSIKSTRNADVLIITVVGGSAELVRDSMDSVVAELVFKHDAILNTYKVDISKELARLDLEQIELKKLLAMVLKGKALETGFGVMTIQHDLENKLNRSSRLRESISSSNVRPTTLIEDVSVTEKRMLSSLWRACLLGIFTGVFLSALWIRWGK